jgi:hypothetical protein
VICNARMSLSQRPNQAMQLTASKLAIYALRCLPSGVRSAGRQPLRARLS